MVKLIYSAISSLDGYVADENGNFDWAAPDEQVHAFVNDLERPVGTYLLGRRMYETMSYWEAPDLTGQSPAAHEFAGVWQNADKVVYSTTLQQPSSARTQIEKTFQPDSVRRRKIAASADITVGGPHLAAQAIRAGLVDEIQLFLAPVLIGGGNRALPAGVRLDLELVEHRRFDSGFVFGRYRPKTPR